MTDSKQRKVDLYVQGLFEHGLEGYDASQKMTRTKGVTNPGGAKVFFHQNFRTPQSNIIINHPGLRQAIKEAPVVVYALNRIELDEEGKPQMVEGGDGYRRIYTGLMLYMDFAGDGTSARDLRDRLLEAVPEVKGLGDYIDVGSNIEDPDGKLQVISELKHQNFARELVPLELHNCIFLALPSGAPGSTQFWSFRNTRAQGRQSMTRSVTAGAVETDGLPL